MLALASTASTLSLVHGSMQFQGHFSPVFKFMIIVCIVHEFAVSIHDPRRVTAAQLDSLVSNLFDLPLVDFAKPLFSARLLYLP